LTREWARVSVTLVAMKNRRSVNLCAVVVFVALVGRTVQAQDVFRTPWGEPDLQGIYTTDEERSVPMERPARFGQREMLTKKELASRVADEARSVQDDKENRTRWDSGPLHWFEFSEQPSGRTSLVVDPADGQIPEQTLGAKVRSFDPNSVLGFVGGAFDGGPLNGPEDLNLSERCITRGLPHTWFPSAYNNGFQIVQSPGYVAVLYERLHEHRVIPVDGRPTLAPTVRQWFGDSRGRWEGESLVVEVTNFSDRTNYKGAGSTLRLIERYTRVDPDTIRVEITVADPATWVGSWTFAMTGKKDPAYWQVFEYACHETNYGLSNILSVARNLEKRGDSK